MHNLYRRRVIAVALEAAALVLFGTLQCTERMGRGGTYLAIVGTFKILPTADVFGDLAERVIETSTQVYGIGGSTLDRCDWFFWGDQHVRIRGYLMGTSSPWIDVTSVERYDSTTTRWVRACGA